MAGSEKYSQEAKVASIFTELKDGFKKADSTSDITKQQNILRDLTNRMQDVKTLIKAFEQEARAENMPSQELANRKKAMVQELNNFITMKKERSSAVDAKKELLAESSSRGQQKTVSEMSTQELMTKGRKEMQAQEDSLIRAQRIVESTIEVGTKTAETLHQQGQQMERVLDALEEIKFSMKKANQVIRDITRSIATDKCIQLLLMVVVVAVVVVIICKSVGVGSKSSSSPLPTLQAPPPPPTTAGRRMLTERGWRSKRRASFDTLPSSMLTSFGDVLSLQN